MSKGGTSPVSSHCAWDSSKNKSKSYERSFLKKQEDSDFKKKCFSKKKEETKRKLPHLLGSLNNKKRLGKEICRPKKERKKSLHDIKKHLRVYISKRIDAQ